MVLINKVTGHMSETLSEHLCSFFPLIAGQECGVSVTAHRVTSPSVSPVLKQRLKCSYMLLLYSISIKLIALEATNFSFRFMKLKINILGPFSQATTSCHSIIILCLPLKQSACHSG